MSHVVTLSIEINCIESLRKAAELCGMTLSQASTFNWYGTSVGDYPIPDGFTAETMEKCEYKLSVNGQPDAYEVGISRRADGKLVPLFDFYGRQGYLLEQAIGAGGSKLKQEYAIAAATKELLRKGCRVTRTVNEKTGKPQLIGRLA